MWACCGFDVTILRGLFSISFWLSEYEWSASVHDRQESSPGGFEHIMKQILLYPRNAAVGGVELLPPCAVDHVPYKVPLQKVSAGR